MPKEKWNHTFPHSGTEVTVFPDGGIQVRVPDNCPDGRLAGKTFYEWSEGSYVSDPKPGFPTVVINKDEGIKVKR